MTTIEAIEPSEHYWREVDGVYLPCTADWHDKDIRMARQQTYETMLRDCIRDFEQMVSQELEYMRTGKGAGVRMRDGIGQWASLCRDARNLLNREDSSYGKKSDILGA